MIAKCPCDHCGKNIEFATEEFLSGSSVACPHCGKETFLSVSPKSKPAVSSLSKLPPPKPTAPPPAPPPIEIAVTNLIKSLIRNQPLIAWVCAAFFALTSILFACLYLSEEQSLQKTQTALAMSEAASAELRKNVQAAEARDKVSELAAEGRQILSGIYYCQQAININELDLRSDGSAVWLNDSSGQKFGTAKWTTDGDTVTVETASRTDNFKIEGTDLIDSRGNRWLHIRR